MDVREKLVEILTNAGMGKYETQYIADALISHGVTVWEWIAVKDRLPEKEGNYIVHGNLGGVFGLFYDDMLSNSFKQMVTHWMPLPQPPKGE